MAKDALFCAQDWMLAGKEVVIVTFLDGPIQTIIGHQMAMNEEGECTDQTALELINQECASQLASVLKSGEPVRARFSIQPPKFSAGDYELYIERVG